MDTIEYYYELDDGHSLVLLTTDIAVGWGGD